MKKITEQDLLRFKASLDLLPKYPQEEQVLLILNRFLGEDLLEEAKKESLATYSRENALWYLRSLLWTYRGKRPNLITEETSDLIIEAYLEACKKDQV